MTANAFQNLSGTITSTSEFADQMRKCYSDKSVLVAGADGLIGSHLSRRLVDLGAKLSVLTRRDVSPVAEIAHECVIGDFGDPKIIEQILRDQSVVFDCVGSLSAVSSMDCAAETFRNECTAHIEFFESCAKLASTPVVVFPSSRLVYGVPKSLPVSESHPINPSSHYALAKCTVERFLELTQRNRGLRSRVFRLSNPYASRAHIEDCRYNVVTRFASMIAGGEAVEIFGDGSQQRDYIAVRDVVNAMIAGGSDPSNSAEIFNLGGPRSISIRESVELMVDAADGLDARFVAWPEGDLKVETGDYCSDTTKLRERYALPAFVDPSEGLRELVLSLKSITKEEPASCVK